MNHREAWNTLSVEDQKAHRKLRNENKKKAKALQDLGRDLNAEENAFVKEHRSIPGSERRRKKKKRPKDWKKKYKDNREEKLQLARDRIAYAKKIVVIDVEKFMFNKRITEVGITTIENNETKHEHFIIEENYKYRNKSAGLKDEKDHFNFGDSTPISIKSLSVILNIAVHDALVIGHAFQNDVEFLKNYYEFDISEVLDTQHIAKYYFSEYKSYGLKFMLDHFGIQHDKLHNAGNDAAYTHMVMQKLLEVRREDGNDMVAN